jgi:hypothetical protein
VCEGVYGGRREARARPVRVILAPCRRAFRVSLANKGALSESVGRKERVRGLAVVADDGNAAADAGHWMDLDRVTRLHTPAAGRLRGG